MPSVETPIGRLPEPADLDTRGLDLPPDSLAKLLRVDIDGWMAEIASIRQHFAQFGSRLPQGLNDEVADLEKRLKVLKN